MKKEAVSLKSVATELAYPLILLGAAFLVYAPGIREFGLYWDDLPNTFFALQGGALQVMRSVATARPALSVIFYLPYRLLGANPFAWQIFCIGMRWLMTYVMVLFLNTLFAEQERANGMIGFLILVYPGFRQQWISKIYPHIFIVFTLEFTALIIFLKALRSDGKRKFLLGASSLLLSFFCLNASEYVFGMEFLRPVIIFLEHKRHTKEKDSKHIILHIAREWAPFLIAGIIFILLRTFAVQSSLYDVRNPADYFASPWKAFLDLLGFSLESALYSIVTVWEFALSPHFFASIKPEVITVLPFVVAGGFAYYSQFQEKNRTPQSSISEYDLSLFSMGLLILLFAGIPFWAAGLTPRTDFPNDRFFLSYMFGASLLLFLIINLFRRIPALQIFLFTILFGISCLFQFQIAESFKQDWIDFKHILNQFAWRAPSFEHGTLIVAEDLPLKYYSDNSLTGALNWLYATDESKNELPLMLNYTTVRLGKSLSSLSSGTPVDQGYLLYEFHGSTDDMVVVFNTPSGCLHFADPAFAPPHPGLAPILKETARRSNLGRINPVIDQNQPYFILPEDSADWCYYFQKASFAYQFGQFDVVRGLGDEAFFNGLHPQDPLEAIPFIISYALNEEWDAAIRLSLAEPISMTAYHPIICTAWNIIDETTKDGSRKAFAFAKIDDGLSCRFDK